ncbi:MAG TPA: anthranilate phosphoribosyltransferase [Flavobacterium sp.]|nr:anthranilate phosphoribosyltransferase [Flavobacterium sp.]
MKDILNKLINQETLSKEEAKSVLVNISSGFYNPSQTASFLTVFMMRNITLNELSGFREALLELCISVDFSDFNAVDLCGTGGDGKDTFNISTLASFVAAGAGAKVAKHGNYGVSSISGSSNVMENLGVKFSSSPEFLKRCIDKANIAILHAPLFHPAMKNVGPIRKELGIKTFFNILGPMVNPSFPKNQVIGVFSLELARMYAYLYQNTYINYSILHALDGYDEISLTGDAKIIARSSERIINARDFNLRNIDPDEIRGGNSVQEAAGIFMNIISGKGTKAQNEVVCANAGLAIAAVENIPLADGYHKAEESLKSGSAFEKLKKLQQLSSSL